MTIIIDKNSNFSHKGGDKDNPRRVHSQSSAPSHTPGPWAADQCGNIRLINNDSVAMVFDPGDHMHYNEIASANASLVAAAPLLLEACKEALDDLTRIDHSYHCGEGPSWDLLRAAINAAQGNSGSGDLK